jgi:putative ABC transport system permease protein
MDRLLQDLRFAVRSLRKNPGFTLVATLTLAVAIGASTAMFTIVNTVLLRPLEYRDPEQLVIVRDMNPAGRNQGVTSPANFVTWRANARSFSELAATYDQPRNLTSPGDPEEILARLTTDNFFGMLRVNAQLGRMYGPGEDDAAVVVISHGLWQRRFGADPRIVGRTVTINDRVRTIVGVAPADFRSVGARPDAWIPLPLDPNWRGRFLSVMGRLRPATSVEQAKGEMTALARRLAEELPQFNRNRTALVVPLHDQVTANVRPALLVLFGAVGVLLLIACANVANLLLGRAATRRTEIAVRLSLGATRARVIRQVLTESVLLAVIAGALGVIIAVWGTDALVTLLPADLALPRLDEVQLDARVLGFTVAICLLTGILFGTAPAILGSSVNLAQDTREGMRGTTGGGTRVRSALVVAEVALAMVLLVGAGLLGRSLQQLLHVDTGIRTDQVLTMRLMLTATRYQKDESELRAFMQRLLGRVQSLPGADAVGGEMYLPLTGLKIGHAFTRDDRPRPGPGEELGADVRVIAGDHFRALGIPVLRGRGFDERDTEHGQSVFMINEELARRYFPDRDPIGQRISFEWDDMVTGEIVGIVGNVREMGPREPPSPAIYRTYSQMPMPQMTLVIRTDGDPLALASSTAAVVRELDPAQPVAEVRTMEHVLADTVARPRLILYVLGGFAAVALLLAALGLYGIVSYSVTQRRREIGVRVALGAQRRDVLRPILREGMLLTALGLALGFAASFASTQVMQSLLFEVEATDPLTLAAVALFLAATALAASYVPARRATRLDPVVALRMD